MATILSVPDAISALQNAPEAETVLFSAPAAAQSLGIGGWLALVAEARRQVPDRPCLFVLDCADAPGLALDALRAGVPAVRLRASAAVLAKVADIAEQSGARLFPSS